MSRFFRLLFLLLFCSISAGYAQERIYPDYNSSSGFELDSLDAYNPLVLDNLETLARVWGFVKYHHPAMADTTIHIDYELFGLLPRVAHAKKAERNRILLEWIDGFGSYEVDTTYQRELAKIDHIVINDFSWVEDTVRLGGDLSRTLFGLRTAVQRGNKFVSASDNGITVQLYDDSFPEYNYKSPFDAGYRLLSLFRFWNAIDSYCPNRNINDTPWDEVLTAYIPQMILYKNSNYIITLLELYAELDDTHAFGPYYVMFGHKRANVVAKIIDNRLIVTATYQNDLLIPGDEIISVANQSVSDIIQKTKRYTSQSNKSTLLRDAADYIFYTRKDSLNIIYQRNKNRNTLSVSTILLSDYDRYKKNRIRENEPYKIINNDIFYINIGSLGIEEASDIFGILKYSKALIIDLRKYPKDFSVLFNFFAQNFIQTPVEPVIMQAPYWAFPGLFVKTTGRLFGKNEYSILPDQPEWRYCKNEDAYKGKIIILVSDSTQSRAEYFTMNLQAIPGAITVGSQTAGADGDVVIITMPGQLNVCFSSIKMLYPDGTDTQRVGVRIDHEVKPTVEGIKAGKDEVLEYAINLINTL